MANETQETTITKTTVLGLDAARVFVSKIKAKQDASTAITTSNIGSQTVAAAGKATNDVDDNPIKTTYVKVADVDNYFATNRVDFEASDWTLSDGVYTIATGKNYISDVYMLDATDGTFHNTATSIYKSTTCTLVSTTAFAGFYTYVDTVTLETRTDKDGNDINDTYATNVYVAAQLNTKANKATTISGYGITDAKITDRTVTLGSNSIAVPTEVTETTVTGWGFTKNTGTYSKPTGGIPKTDLASAVQTSLGKADTALQPGDVTETDPVFSASAAAGITSTDISNWNSKTSNTGTYSKPSGGIPKTDLDSAVQTSLGKADTALQPGDVTHPVTSVNGDTGAVVINTDDGDIPTATITGLYTGESTGEDIGSSYYTKAEVDTLVGNISAILTELGL